MSRRVLRFALLSSLFLGVVGCSESTVDNDTLKLHSAVISPSAPIYLIEGGASGTYDIVLNTAPAEDVTFTMFADAPEKVVFSSSIITGTFYPNAKSVQVKCVDDGITTGPVDIQIEMRSTSLDPTYNGISIKRTVTCSDAPVLNTNSPAVPVDPALDDLCPDDPGKTGPGVCGCGIPDTEENTAILDNGYAQCLAHYAPGAEESADGLDLLEPDAFTLSENGDSQMFAMALKSQPADTVVVPMQVSNPGEAGLDFDSVVFTPDNWNEPQYIIIHGRDDELRDGDKEVVLTIGPTVSNDERYSGLQADPMVFVNHDNEFAIPDLVVSTHDVTVHEGGTSGELYISLSANPLDGVNGPAVVLVQVTPSNRSEVQLSAEALVFDAENWNIPQTVQIKAFKDNVIDGNKSVELTITSDSDENCGSLDCYRNKSYDSVHVTGIDKDAIEAAANAPKLHKIHHSKFRQIDIW